MKKSNDMHCITENLTGMVKAHKIGTKNWVTGFQCVMSTGEDNPILHHYIIPAGASISAQTGFKEVLVEVDPMTICRYTGKTYMDGQDAYEGDIFESQICGLLMVLQYGTFQAYCPVDDEYMDSIGFYAEALGYPQMPIGDISDYALKKGNVYDNPGLATGILYLRQKNVETICNCSNNDNNGWITSGPPENEVPVLVTVERKGSRSNYRMVVIAFYTDGNHNTEESNYCWEDGEFEYDEDTDTYIIPEGWWESTDYEECFHEIADTVTAWRPLPEEYRGNQCNDRSDKDE